MSEFPISCWTYYPLSRAYGGMVKDWRDLGITNPMTPSFSEGDDRDKMLGILDECQEYGLKVYLCDKRVIMSPGKMAAIGGESAYRAAFRRAYADFGTHPAVKGFCVGDEPDAPDAADYFAAARIQREEAPELTPYLNLLPWFDWIGDRIGSASYGPYLDRAAKEGKLKLLAYDCYTQMWKGESGYDVYFNNLREHMEASLQNNIPFCTTLLSSGHYDYNCPTDDDFRWQISTAVAFGAKSIAWFYIHGTAPGENYRKFPINAFDERTYQFECLSYENRAFLKKFGALMLELTPEKPAFTSKAYGGAGLFEPDGIMTAAKGSKGYPLLISRFSGPEDAKYYAVVNLDRTDSQCAELAFAPGFGVEIKSFSGGFSPVVANADAVGARSEKGGRVSRWLAPGQMELFKVKRA